MALSRLWNDDILHDILGHLAPSGFPASQADRPGLIALAVCARVNKLFYGSAVDVLWREVDSLAVVLSVLTPPLLRTESTHQRTFALAGAIPECVYARFQYYASRVRRLSHRAERDRIQPEVLVELHRRADGEPLFPKLKSLYWSQRTAPDVSEIVPLISPSLRELCISEIGSQTSLVPPSGTQSNFSRFIHSLSAAAPSIETLTLSGYIHPSFVLCVSELKQLRALNIINFAQRGFGAGYLPVIRSCAALSHLRDLGINLTGDGVHHTNALAVTHAGSADPTLEGDFTGFNSLRSLRVHGSLALVSRFISHVASAELASFGVFVPHPDRFQDYHACLTTLCSRFAESLRVVRFSGTWTGTLASLPRPMDILAPLLLLPQLEEVCILSGTGVASTLTAADTLAIAQAWPRLRELKLLYQSVPAALPIDALGAFAVHCPRLRALWIASVDLRGVGSRDLGACQASNHGLKHIWLPGDVASADVNRVAEFLDRIFPYLDPRPVELPWHPGQVEGGWEQLLVCLRKLQAARRAGTPSQLMHKADCIMQP
ncbi:uncharacterized protein TRAVEDRAFT_28078 [Trametes versicolor FP-101664 SS1]|uniref:uncharacterized protein n=1 Tax=Trametes versicolor (strain FP-101664) TaxID=717944 RepID=UPI00046228EE|nr:uncharacterized protein TRAVEDRAFT_28078 [Trametes versicolor FP-101664 SS1]EIW60535.1 hypothetical protein TRAVEDRAFT_28078 [Trametes versicolor FP-101664 SS1]